MKKRHNHTFPTKSHWIFCICVSNDANRGKTATYIEPFNYNWHLLQATLGQLESSAKVTAVNQRRKSKCKQQWLNKKSLFWQRFQKPNRIQSSWEGTLVWEKINFMAKILSDNTMNANREKREREVKSYSIIPKNQRPHHHPLHLTMKLSREFMTLRLGSFKLLLNYFNQNIW